MKNKNANKLAKSNYNDVIDGKLRFVLPAILVVIAALFIAYGVKDGEMAAVFNKAINLCRECVGIG